MMFGYGMGLGWILMLVFWGLLIVLAVWLVKALFSGGSSPTPPSNSARAILDQRYARGEISREQYDQMKQDLS